MNWNKTDILKEIERRRATGEPLYSHFIRKNLPELMVSALRQFGGWKEAVAAAGLAYHDVRKYKTWTPDTIIREIQRLNAEGMDLSFRSMMLSQNASLVYAAIRPKRFGSWRRALAMAGLASVEIYRYRSWDDDSIIDEIRRLHRMGTDLSSKKMDETANSLISTARRRFGSWSSALARAGIEYESIRKRRRWTKDKVLQEIRRLHTEGQCVSSRMVRSRYPSLYSAACKTAFFGSWSKALEASHVPHPAPIPAHPGPALSSP
ncbi:MAG: hypothetical protein SFY92_06890 [Verrucomicrobiae bacterium]|nr:hypothetical protein [Verrucomicrobiae bacterium]